MSPDPATEKDPETQNLRRSHLEFPVVGIGASAGGLEALQTFFRHMPDASGMAFVVVLHLSPNHESHAAEILQRCTTMKVAQAQEPLPLEPDHVYIIPPSSDLSMDDGHLRLSPSRRGLNGVHAAIDIFFRTMAQVHRKRSICIVLSGTGTDGAVGLTRVKEAGGLTLAQTPGDALHGGMPGAAIDTGMVDLVMPVAEMPGRLLALWNNMRNIRMPAELAPVQVAPSPERPAEADAEQTLNDIMAVLRTHTGHDFRPYKRATLLRRIERRLQVNGQPDLGAYHGFLQANPGETALLLQDLLISVTHFFRDGDAFEALAADAIAPLFDGRSPGETVRAWVAGCATGEEAYTLAILLQEAAERHASPAEFQIFASDIDERAIAVARAGVYPGAIAADITPARLQQFFVKEGDNFRVVKSIRERTLFATHNVLRDPPFSRLDLVCCRNLLIYLERRAQTDVLEMFRFALRPHGALFLGSSESPDGMPDAFIPIDKKHRIFRRRADERAERTLPIPLPAGAGGPASLLGGLMAQRQPPSHAEIHRRSLEQLLPPSVLVDARGDILNVSDGAGRFLEHGSGPPSPNLLANVCPELRLELRTALHAAAQKREPVEVRDLRIERRGQARCMHVACGPSAPKPASRCCSSCSTKARPGPRSRPPSPTPRPTSGSPTWRRKTGT